MNVPYHSARLLGALTRKLYSLSLGFLCRGGMECAAPIEAHVFSFSGRRDLPEQVASLRSFLRHAGVPASFTVVSDGSHGSEEIALLKAIHPCVEVKPYPQFARMDLPDSVKNLSTRHVLGKKLGLLLSLPENFPQIFMDSDILFFPGAERLPSWLEPKTENFALEDCHPIFSPALSLKEEELHPPLNSGFLIMNRALDWKSACERLASAGEKADHWTEQTVVHLAWRENHGALLPKEFFCVERDDEFVFRDRFAGNRMLLRHYVSPIRHKFWVRLAGPRFWQG